MHPLYLRLADGAPGGIGAARAVAAEVAAEVADDPDALAVLVDGMAHPTAGVRNRAAWVIDRVTRRHPDRLAPHAGALLDAAEADRPGGTVRRLLPLLLSALVLDAPQARRVMTWAMPRLGLVPVAEHANLLEALAAVALHHPDLSPTITPPLHEALDHAAPSVRARARHLLARLDRLRGLGGADP